jgi:DNA-binding response OmpR family regulator
VLRAERSPARFIFLTTHTEARLAAEAMRSGAVGYLLKHAAGEELIDAIQAVMNGRTYLTPLILHLAPCDCWWAQLVQSGKMPTRTRRAIGGRLGTRRTP